jgi:hypothetical protein
METVANENFATPDRPGVVKPPPWLLALVAENRYAAFLITGYTVFRKNFRTAKRRRFQLDRAERGSND